MKSFSQLATAVAGLALGGCLVSDEPLFDAATGSASPLASGRYEACSEPLGDSETECQFIAVTKRDDGAFEFLVEETDTIAVRFHAMGGADYAAQFADDDGDGFQYYWAQAAGETLALAMIWCEDLPTELRAAMRRDGLIAYDDGDSTCTALKPEAVVKAAAAYRDGAAKPDSVLRLTPAP